MAASQSDQQSTPATAEHPDSAQDARDRIYYPGDTEGVKPLAQEVGREYPTGPKGNLDQPVSYARQRFSVVDRLWRRDGGADRDGSSHLDGLRE